ncbi:MAG: hypothetical protein JO101_12450, partial [Candidatus Eremiobacteraeota bacterium]|nr:hypothetical protein [Candidatus Eremiobacteraeota bacterium]
QTATATVTQSDPVGNVISTANGPVANWLPITLSTTDTSGTVSFCTPNPITSPPSTAAGSTCTITYNGGTPSSTSLSVLASASFAPAPSNTNLPSLVARHPEINFFCITVRCSPTATVQFVSLSASPSTVSLPDTVSTPSISVSEPNGALSYVHETGFILSTSPTPNPGSSPGVGCASHATFSVALNTFLPLATAPPASVSHRPEAQVVNAASAAYTVRANDATSQSNCTLTVTSAKDSHLTTNVTISFPGTVSGTAQ